MTGFVVTSQGERLQLPVPLKWEMVYTAGIPCDSFWLSVPWDRDQQADPGDWVRFQAVEQGECVFTGVIDECELRWSAAGSCLEISGRGMAALLLDNEAVGQDYAAATLQDILRDHVYPFGLEVAGRPVLPAVSRFSVATGSSEWSVLYDFARFYGGITPRFDRAGRLVLEGWSDSANLKITDTTPVSEISLRQRRYGVLSEIWVRDRTRQTVEKVENKPFKARGGCCRRVMTMPGRSDFKAMRYSGQYQLDKSAAQQLRLEVTIPILFYGKPGDLVELQRYKWPENGRYRVVEVRVIADEQGGRTVLELADPNVTL